MCVVPPRLDRQNIGAQSMVPFRSAVKGHHKAAVRFLLHSTGRGTRHKETYRNIKKKRLSFPLLQRNFNSPSYAYEITASKTVDSFTTANLVELFSVEITGKPPERPLQHFLKCPASRRRARRKASPRSSPRWPALPRGRLCTCVNKTVIYHFTFYPSLCSKPIRALPRHSRPDPGLS